MKIKLTSRERAEMFVQFCSDSGMTVPVLEFVFDEKPVGERRRWRFDFAWTGERLALEVQGGVWVQGKHGRGAGIVKDNEKRNAAAVLGWRVLCVQPSELCTLQTLSTVQDALAYEPRARSYWQLRGDKLRKK